MSFLIISTKDRGDIKFYNMFPEDYCTELCEKTNSLLVEIEKNLALSINADIYNSLNLSIGIDLENTSINAFSHKDTNGKYYIAVSMGLINAFYNQAKSISNNLELTSHLSIENESLSEFIDYIYFNMLFYAFSHEMGHILLGHLSGSKSSSTLYEFEPSTSSKQPINLLANKKQQILEFKADGIAISGLYSIFYRNIEKNNTAFNLTELWDILYLAMYFAYFSLTPCKEISSYLDNDSYNTAHPHPCIRLAYSKNYLFNYARETATKPEILVKLFNRGTYLVRNYLEKNEAFKGENDSFFYIIKTEKAKQHIKELVDGAQAIIPEYRPYTIIDWYSAN